jgi:hypothetical protein
MAAGLQAAALAGLAWTVHYIRFPWRMRRRGSSAAGIIVELGGGDGSVRCRVEYRIPEGLILKKKMPVPRRLDPDVGKWVDVLYLPKNPRVAMVSPGRWNAVAIVAGMVGFAVLQSLALMLMQ